MFEIRKGVNIVIFSYIIICILIWSCKPSVMFTEEGDVKQVGVGHNRTPYSFPIVIILIAILLCYFHEIYWIKTNNLI